MGTFNGKDNFFKYLKITLFLKKKNYEELLLLLLLSDHTVFGFIIVQCSQTHPGVFIVPFSLSQILKNISSAN